MGWDGMGWGMGGMDGERGGSRGRGERVTELPQRGDGYFENLSFTHFDISVNR